MMHQQVICSGDQKGHVANFYIVNHVEDELRGQAVYRQGVEVAKFLPTFLALLRASAAQASRGLLTQRSRNHVPVFKCPFWPRLLGSAEQAKDPARLQIMLDDGELAR